MAAYSTILGNDGASLSTNGLTASRMKNFRIETGNGQKIMKIGAADPSPPKAGGRFEISGGAGATTFVRPDATNVWTLGGDNAGTLTNTTPGQNGAAGIVNFLWLFRRICVCMK